MKKYLSIVGGIILAVLLFFAFMFFTKQKRKAIPLVEGLSFGMPAEDANQLFGEACEVQPDVGDTGKTMYIYQSEVLGQQARITCFFTQDDRLTEIHFQWDDCTSDVYDQAYTCLHGYYSDHRDFFEKTENEHSVSLGTDNGATGLFYSIYKDDTSVRITRINLI